MSLVNITCKLDRTDKGTPWGFRLHGGADYHAPLSIQRVTPGSLGANCGLLVGDAIVKIGGLPTQTMRHQDAMNQIVSCGNNLELTLQRTVYDPREIARLKGGAPVGGQPPYGGAADYQDYQVNRAPPPGLNAIPAIQPDQYGDYNRAAAPFAGSAGPAPAVSSPYGVGNLAAQTRGLNLGSPGEDPIPPWRSGAPSQPAAAQYQPPRPAPAPAAVPAAPPMARAPAGVPGTWQPKVPTGPRKMRAGRAGEAKSMGAGSYGTRIPMCATCGISIRGPFVSALDKTWCPDCFCCSNPNCKVPLMGIGFVEEEGQLFCEKDYEQFFAPRCKKCGKPIMRECVNALKETYHPECFLCCVCGRQIGQGAFHIEDGKFYCEKDWQAMFQTKCMACQFPIEPGDRWVEALNDNWHSECFNCSTCQCNLEGMPYYAKGGRPFCKKHAGVR